MPLRLQLPNDPQKGIPPHRNPQRLRTPHRTAHNQAMVAELAQERPQRRVVRRDERVPRRREQPVVVVRTLPRTRTRTIIIIRYRCIITAWMWT